MSKASSYTTIKKKAINPFEILDEQDKGVVTKREDGANTPRKRDKKRQGKNGGHVQAKSPTV